MNLEMRKTKLIFLNVGWMEKYQGLNGDSIQGGGGFVQEHGYGHEMFNFLPWQGRMYGYAETKRVNIERLGARPNAKSVSGILGIWVARNPNSGGTFIVGWYDNATLYREPQEPIWAANRRISEYITKDIKAVPGDTDKHAFFIISAEAKDCQLIPPSERIFQIPRGGKGDMGRRNLWYADDTNKVRFREQVVSYISKRQEQEHARQIDARQIRKYGVGGEGIPHRLLKEWCASNPQELGLQDVIRVPAEKECQFICGDRADVVFEMPGNQYVVLEVETTNAEPGAYQALKYKTLLCAEQGLPIDSAQVSALLVAWQVPPSVRSFCDKYKIKYLEKVLKNDSKF